MRFQFTLIHHHCTEQTVVTRVHWHDYHIGTKTDETFSQVSFTWNIVAKLCFGSRKMLPSLTARETNFGPRSKNVFELLRVKTFLPSVSERTLCLRNMFPCLTTEQTIRNTVRLLLSGPSIKRTPFMKRTVSLVPKLASYIYLYNKPLYSGHLY